LAHHRAQAGIFGVFSTGRTRSKTHCI
jgi:hypothetical protein